MQMHGYAQAIQLFERYLALMPSADDRMRVREQVAYLRAWLDQN
jgi:regulator of sirC expression with transglutaminase-like and TPR domain